MISLYSNNCSVEKRVNIMATDRITRTFLVDKINQIIIMKSEGNIYPPT